MTRTLPTPEKSFHKNTELNRPLLLTICSKMPFNVFRKLILSSSIVFILLDIGTILTILSKQRQ